MPGLHDNWVLNYQGIDLPIPTENGLSEELQPIGKYNRDCDGDMHIESVALKKVVRIRWEALNGEDTQRLLFVLSTHREGVLRYPSTITKNIESMDCYYGAGAQVTMRLFRDSSIAQRFTNISANFIER